MEIPEEKILELLRERGEDDKVGLWAINLAPARRRR